MLFKATVEIYKSDCFTHIDIPFTVDDAYSCLIIKYKYSPKKYEGNDAYDLALNAFKDIYGNLDVSNSDVTSELPLNNHITISVSKGDELIGTAHRHANDMTLEIGDNPTPGFYPRKIEQGSYTITLSCHAVISEKIVAMVEVYGQK